MDGETAQTLITAIVGPAGVGLGYAFSRLGARSDRVHLQAERLRERQEDAAAQFDHDLIEIGDSLPTSILPPVQARGMLIRAQAELRRAWSRSYIVRDESVDLRYTTLDALLSIALDDCGGSGADKQGLDFSLLSVSYEELRRGLQAFILRETIPRPMLPGRAGLVKLAYPESGSRGLKGVQRYLDSCHEAD